jgi:CubicO group peptidase (beta-lactamase class C family)
VRLRGALLGLGAVALVVPGCASGPASVARPPFADVLDAELSAICADPAQPLASLSVLAIRGGEVVYEAQFGRRHIADAAAGDKPATRETLYRIASISKLVTTLGVMRLVEEGRVSLDTDVGEYLGWKLRNPHYPDAPITLRMLLTHMSSLRDDAGYYGWPSGARIRDFLVPGGALYGEGRMWSARARPGAWFSYANLPWGVVATVMEKATGERFDRLMRRLVLLPLEMQGGFEPAEFAPAQLDNLATLYRKRTAEGDELWNPEGPWIAQVDDLHGKAPAHRASGGYEIGSNGLLFGPQGNLRASAADLGRVMRMLMARGELDGLRFLRRETVDLMLSRQWSSRADAGNSSYGTGKDRMNEWGLGNQHFLDVGGAGSGDRLVEGGGFTGVGHHGDAWGLNGILVFDRASRDGIVYLGGGPGSDPELRPGRYSSFHRYEERIMTALYRRAIQGRRD